MIIRELTDRLYVLEATKPSQWVKNKIYREIRLLREGDDYTKDPKFCDDLGFNLLHWAVLCNQSTEIIRLIAHKGIDVNCGTEATESAQYYNVTPFHLAMHTDNTNIAELLLDYGANPDIKYLHKRPYDPKIDGWSYNALFFDTQQRNARLEGEHSYKPQKTSIFTTRLSTLGKKTEAFTLFEKELVEEYYTKRVNDYREYKSILPGFIASFFHYSSTQKLSAHEALDKLLKKEPQIQDKDRSTWLSDLKNLKSEHPAIDQGELGNIYRAGLQARGL